MDSEDEERNDYELNNRYDINLLAEESGLHIGQESRIDMGRRGGEFSKRDYMDNELEMSPEQNE